MTDAQPSDLEPVLPSSPYALRGREPAAGGLEWVQAFRANAEALDRLGAMHVELARSLQRSDRSELMLQSTAALNESFRNMATIQRELLRALEDRDSGRKRSRLPALASLGFLIVLVGGIAALVEAIRGSRAHAVAVDPSHIAREIQQSFVAGRSAAATEREEERVRLAEEREAARTRVQELDSQFEQQLDALAEADRTRRALETENEFLRQDVARGQQAAIAKEHLAREIERLQREEGQRDVERARFEREIDLLRGTNLDLKQRIADYGLGLPDEDAGGLESTKAPFGVPNVRTGGDARNAKEGAKESELAAAPESPAPAAASERAPDRNERQVLPSEALVSPLAVRSAVEGTAPEPSLGAQNPLGVPGPVAPGGSSVPPPPLVRRSLTTDAARERSSGNEERSLLDPQLPQLPPQAPPPTALFPDMAPPAAAPPTHPEATFGAPDHAPGLVRRDTQVDRDPARMRAVRDRLNALLDRARGEGRGSFTLVEIDGISGDRLGGISLVRYDPNDRPENLIRARDLRIHVDRLERTVSFVVGGGTSESSRGKQNLPEEGLQLVVARGDALLDAWLASGLKVITAR